MKTMKILIIATALATTLGPVSVYAMDQGQGPEEAAAAAQPMSAEQVRQLELTAQRTPHIAPFLPVARVANIASEYASFTPEQVAQANRDLTAAVLADDVVGVAQALDHGVHINQPGQRGYTPLGQGCFWGRTGIVKLLLSRGARINQPNHNGSTPLCDACMGDHTGTVELLLSSGAHINQPNKFGATPLTIASTMGGAGHRYTGIVELLLSSGAHINQPDRDGRTPLVRACFSGHTEAVELLLSRGADINQPDQGGGTPLMFACRNGYTGIVKRLAFHGATLSGRETAAMQPVIEQAREARRNVGDSSLSQRDVHMFVPRCTPLSDLENAIRTYADPFVGVQDPELRELIQKQILKNRQERCVQERAAAQEGAAAEQENKEEEVKDEEVKDDNAVQPIAHAVEHDQQDDDAQQDGDAPRKSVCNRSTCIVL